MAETKNKNKKNLQQSASPLIGHQAQPTTLDSTTTLDIDINKTLPDNIIEAGLSHKLDVSALENFTSVSNSRDQIYQLVDTMAQDSSVAAILRTYAEDVCETADNGHVIWCEANDPKISKYINYILNVMNADKNIYSWAYSLLKYGDIYLRLFRESDYVDDLFKTDNINKAYSARNVLNEDLRKQLEEDNKLEETVNLSIHNSNDPYSYYVEMVDDPATMFELTKFGKTFGYIEVPNSTTSLNFIGTTSGLASDPFNFRLKSADVNVHQADDFVHACLDDNFTRFPETVELFHRDSDDKGHVYSVRRGKSLLYDSYKIWREKALLENSALLNRITRSSVVRKVGVEVGDMSKEQVQQILRRVKEMMEQKSAIDVGNSMAEYNNPGPIENNIYFATHEGKGNITVEAVGGDIEVKNLADLDWWNNKFYSSYGIPKQYFGWTDDGAGFNGGTSLTILSSVYAKGVKRVQNALIQAVTDIINLFLINKGFKSYLNNFTIKMKAPITQEEIDYRADLSNKVTAISSIQGLFTDIEDKPRRLRILKALLSSLNYGDEINTEIDAEIKALEEAAEEAANATDGDESGTDTATDTSGSTDGADIDLGSLDALESLETSESSISLLENQEANTELGSLYLTEDDLPSPSELDADIDFSENN